MDLPQYYFPVRVCPHLGEDGDKKMAFADYGSCSNVNENENMCDGRPKCIPQKAHGRLSGLDSVLPMLPLAGHLNMKDGIGKKDVILGFDNFANLFKSLDGLFVWMNMAQLKLSTNAAGSRDKYEHCKAIIRKLRDRYERLCKLKGHLACDDHSLRRSLESIERKMPRWMVIMLRHYSRLQMAHNDNCFRGFNKDFYKGLLCSLETEEGSPSVLIHGGGPEFKEISLFPTICLDYRDIWILESQLKRTFYELAIGLKQCYDMTRVSKERDTGLYNAEETCLLTVDEPVYQISSYKKGVACIRQKEKCTVLINDISAHSLQFGSNMSVGTNHLSDVCPSPFLAHEILLSGKSGFVTLWNVTTNNCHHLTKKQRFESADTWTSSYFAGHPRQIVIADSTSVELFDHRDSFRKGFDLFTLSPLLVKDELVMSVIPFDFPYHIIGTESTIFMMDQRFPCFPVLQWHLDRMSNPQMLHVKKISETHAIIFVAAQQPAEILCLPVNFERQCPPMCKILPWQVGKPRDIFYEESQSMGIEWSELEERFHMSMAGMTVVNESALGEQAFSVFQMDSCGDLFYQQFAFKDRLDHAYQEQYQLMETSFKTLKEGRQRVRNCLSTLDLHESRLKSNIHPQEANAESSCHLLEANAEASCQPQEFKTEPSCSLKFTDVCRLFEGLEEVELKALVPFESPPDLSYWDKVITPWQSLPTDEVNTQLHIALKEGRDLKNLLEERENDHEEKKLALRNEALKSKAKTRTHSSRKRKN